MTKRFGGLVRRWKDGGILYAQNDFVRLAYVVTDDLGKIGKLGYGPKETIVEYISPKVASLWECGG